MRQTRCALRSAANRGPHRRRLAHHLGTRRSVAHRVRPRDRRRARPASRRRPRPRHSRARCRHRVIGPSPHRHRAPCRALDQRMAQIAGLHRLPRAARLHERRAPHARAALHPRARRPGCPRPPQKKTELISDAHQRSRIGQIEDASATAEYGDVLQQEADLTAGHGVLRVTGLISVSRRTIDELESAVATIEQAAIQTSCEVRRLIGQQAQAFTTAALPLCRAT